MDVSEGIYEKLSWEYIDPMNLTAKDFEDFAATLDLRVEGQSRSNFMEDRVKLPLFNLSFYSFVDYYKYIPRPEDFTNYYETLNKDKLNRFSEDQIISLRGRLYRTYTSLFRDIHFYHFLKESDCFQKVLFVLKYDVESKVDAFVKYRDSWFGLQLFIDTARSWSYYNKKPSRAKSSAVPKNATLVPLPINLKTAYSVKTKGEDLYLYHRRELDELVTRLDKEEYVVAS